MAISTLAGVRQGLRQALAYSKAQGSGNASTMRSAWQLGGYPAAGSFDSTLNGVTLTAPVTGAPTFETPSGALQYLAGLRVAMPANASRSGLILADRLWHNGGYTITSTSAQNSTTPTWPARDVNGSTNGEGVYLAVEVSATVGSGTPTFTVTYTNSAGTTGRSAINFFAASASMGRDTVIPINLQAGDVGVRALESVTLSASWTSGTIRMVAFRPFAFVDTCNAGAQLAQYDALALGLPRIFDGTVLWPIQTWGGTAASSPFAASILVTQG